MISASIRSVSRIPCWGLRKKQVFRYKKLTANEKIENNIDKWNYYTVIDSTTRHYCHIATRQ